MELLLAKILKGNRGRDGVSLVVGNRTHELGREADAEDVSTAPRPTLVFI